MLAKRFDPTRDIYNIKQKFHWDMGRTRIRVDCLLTKIYQGLMPLVFIMYGDKKNVQAIKDEIFLKCTRKKRYFGKFSDQKLTEGSSFLLTLDPNDKSLQSDTVKVGKITHFGERKILSSFEAKEKSLRSDFRLDRYAGSYEQKVIYTRGTNKGSGMEMWGDCSVIKPGKKF